MDLGVKVVHYLIHAYSHMQEEGHMSMSCHGAF